MTMYRITLDVSCPSISARVTFLREAIDADYATRDLGTLYVARDGFVNRTGNTAYTHPGTLYPVSWVATSWSVVAVRKSRARRRSHAVASLKLCDDCLYQLVNGEHGDRPDDLPPVLSKLGPTDEVVPGVMTHDKGCERWSGGDCYCQSLGFCTDACDGCGDWHHGDRYAAVVIEDRYGDLAPDTGRVVKAYI